MKVIITGATGMVGEGVLLECLQHKNVEEILLIGRKPYGLQHPKLKQLIVPDFLKISAYANQLYGYDACFFCAGISSLGMNEEKYTAVTYNTTLFFAKTLEQLNPSMVFNYVSGAGTDSSEKGRLMWARVKGKTENDLMQLGFKGQYNFRPAIMLPTTGQKSLKTSYKILGSIFKYLLPKSTLKLSEVGKAMINTVIKGYHKQVLEVADIKLLSV